MEEKQHGGKAKLHLDEVGGHITELLQLQSETPSFQIIFIPGNPGIITFYQDYIEALHHYLDGRASITGVSHIAHTAKDWEDGKLFSLNDQILHKVHLVEKQVSNVKCPLVLVGHSIGAHIALCVFKKLPDKVQYVVGLYPFLQINKKSSYQALLRFSARISVLRELLSRFAGVVGRLPHCTSKNLVSLLIGRRWSPIAIDAACQYLLQHFVVRNMLYMGMTEFPELQEDPDWAFFKERKNRISLLFGIDDHWGPLTLYEEVSKQAPGLDTAIEREGHKHAFCCTKAGSDWVAGYTANAILSDVSKTFMS